MIGATTSRTARWIVRELNSTPAIITAASFFFSSRRRHTRSLCDWSSDVCSSDLAKCHGIPSHQLLNVASHMPSSNEQSSAIRRPWYLTVVAAVLLLWGAGMSCYFLPGTVKALAGHADRKSTRLNSSHTVISYAVF